MRKKKRSRRKERREREIIQPKPATAKPNHPKKIGYPEFERISLLNQAKEAANIEYPDVETDAERASRMSEN